jgi:hypothetical protein
VGQFGNFWADVAARSAYARAHPLGQPLPYDLAAFRPPGAVARGHDPPPHCPPAGQFHGTANPIGDIYVITDNLSSHNSVSTRT